jgi:hypothetical protein
LKKAQIADKVPHTISTKILPLSYYLKKKKKKNPPPPYEAQI